jgi:hypothetical protein
VARRFEGRFPFRILESIRGRRGVARVEGECWRGVGVSGGVRAREGEGRGGEDEGRVLVPTYNKLKCQICLGRNK